MKRDEIKSAIALAADANTDHQTAEDWYDCYGWHLSTEDAGDVVLQAVSYDWLDATDDADVAHRLREDDAAITPDEALAIVAMARRVREQADQVSSLLDDAVAAYERGDLEACRSALCEAYSTESEAGDEPATQSLADALLIADEDDA